MKITHVITRLVVGGAQENTLATVAALCQKPGVTVHLISGPTRGSEGSLEAEARRLFPLTATKGNADVQPGEFILLPELVRPVHPLLDFLALRRLEKIFRAQQPDIVHTHSGKAGILGRLAARRAGVPVIIHTIHGPSFGRFQNAVANALFLAAEKIATRATTHFIVVAEAMKIQYLAAGIGRPEQYTKIFSGFALEPFLTAVNDGGLRKKLGLASDDFVVGKIARLFKLKGHDDLFAAAPLILRQNPKIKFLLVGDGPWRGRFEKLAGARGWRDHFVFTGLLPPGEIPRYLGVMDTLVHLSRREGLPRALPQALAAGKPVVAYDCDGAGEVCLEGQTGFLIRPGDWAALAEKILRLAADADLRGRLGAGGRQLVRDHFAVENMTEAIYNLYLKLAAAGAAPASARSAGPSG